MTKNNNGAMNVIAKRLAAVFAAIAVTAFSAVPVHALSYSLGYTDNGEGTLFDEEQGIYVDMDTYHAAYGYEYNEDFDAYGYWSDGDFYICNCTACNYWKEGHKIIVPGQEDSESEDTSQEETSVKVLMTGTELGESNLSGEGWSYEQTSNTLTLDSFNYEGTGLFTAADETADDEGDESDSEDEDSEEDEWDEDDEEWDDEDEEWDDEDEEWEDEDEYEDDEDEASDDETDDSEASEPVKGVIYSDGDLTLHLNGVSNITITDEGSDASYAVNVAGELKIEGDGVLYIKSATEEKVYGTEPAEESTAGNYENINTNTNTNDIDNTQTVNEAPVTQNVDEGDVSVSNSNNVDMPDFTNSINLPGASNSIEFDPTIEVKLPQTTVEKIVVSGMQQRYPELSSTPSPAPSQLGRCADIQTASGDVKVADAGQTDASEPETVTTDGTKSEAPETGDSLDLGVLMALIATVVIGGSTGGILIWRRIRGY